MESLKAFITDANLLPTPYLYASNPSAQALAQELTKETADGK